MSTLKHSHVPNQLNRLTLTTVATLGLFLGAVPLPLYAQDVPTPTPPANEGEFDGAPEPTPAPEIELEPVPMEEPGSPGTETPGNGNEPTTPIPADGGVTEEAIETPMGGEVPSSDNSIVDEAPAVDPSEPSAEAETEFSTEPGAPTSTPRSPRALW